MDGEAHAFTFGKVELPRDDRSILVDEQVHRRREDHQVASSERGHSAVHSLEERMDQRVLGTRHELQGQVDLTFDARHAADEKVRRTFAELVSPVAKAHGKCIGDRDRTRRRAKGRLQHHGPVQVAPGRLCRTGGPDRPVAGFLPEEATEDRGAVETWEAKPVDRSVSAHQRGAVPVREKGIVGYRGRAHVSSLTTRCARSTSDRSDERKDQPDLGRRSALQTGHHSA